MNNKIAINNSTIQFSVKKYQIHKDDQLIKQAVSGVSTLKYESKPTKNKHKATERGDSSQGFVTSNAV